MSCLARSVCLGVLVFAARGPRADAPALQSGDVVLQASRSERSVLIRQASRSPYSHVGVVEVAVDGVFVIEAVQPVSRTPLVAWARRGEGQWVTVLRPRGLDAAARARVVAVAKLALGKPYDARYRWDDERLYCSELVVKAFARGAQVSLGRQQAVSSLALTTEQLAQARSLGVDPGQSLVTPGSLAEDEQLELLLERSTAWAEPPARR